jgi:two-component system sensor histidine kinase KdpD
MVCVGASPSAAYLLEQGFELARRFGTGVVAVHIRGPAESSREEVVLRHLQDAQLLGARVVEAASTDIVEGLSALVRQEGASLVLLGKPVRSTYRWHERSIAQRLIEHSASVPVLLVGDPLSLNSRSADEGVDPRSPGARHAVMTVACALLLVLVARIVPPSLALLTAAIGTIWIGRSLRPAVATAIGSLLGFIPALHVAIGASPQTSPLVYLLVSPCLIALIGGLIARLQARIPQQEQALRAREGQLSRLHAAGSDLAAATEAHAAWRICERELQLTLDADVSSCPVDDVPSDAPWASLAREERSRDEAVGHGTRTHPESPWLLVPVKSGEEFFGWLVLTSQGAGHLAAPRIHLFVGSVARLLGVTLERLRLSLVAEQQQTVAIAERLRSDLLSSVSHDLRTPLGIIVGAASWLRDRDLQQDDRTTDELLRAIETEATRLERTLDNLLALTKLSGQPMADRSEWFLEEDIIGAVFERAGTHVHRSRVEIELSEARPLLQVDGVLVELALVNVLDNAFRYGSPAVRVTLKSQPHADAWVLDVMDDGPGIPAEDRPFVFERFFRGRTGRSHRGSGMGLAICKAVAAAHGGDVTLEGRTRADVRVESTGTHVRLVLPARIMARTGASNDSMLPAEEGT